MGKRAPRRCAPAAHIPRRPKEGAAKRALCGVRICRAGAEEVFRRNAISRESPVHQRQVGGLEPTVAREHVCGPDVISTATVNGAREISAGQSPLAKQVARAVRARRNHVISPEGAQRLSAEGGSMRGVGRPQTAGRASRSGQVPDYLSRNTTSAYAPPLAIRLSSCSGFGAFRMARRGEETGRIAAGARGPFPLRCGRGSRRAFWRREPTACSHCARAAP